MGKLLDSVTGFFHLLTDGIKRFYTCTLFTIIAFAMFVILVNTNDISDYSVQILVRIILVSVLGFFMTALFTTVSERAGINSFKLKLANTAVSLVVPALYFFLFLTDMDNMYQVAAIAGIIFALGFITFYYTNKTNSEDFSEHFSFLIKNLAFSAVITLIVFLGLMLCSAAFYFLIYRFPEAKVYGTISGFCWILLFVNLFTAMLPVSKEQYRTPKLFKIITLYTALPIYMGLIIILYIYLAKIVVTHVFPSGQLNWFASFASLIGIILFVSLKQYFGSNALVKWFIRLFGFFVIPIIIMQCIAFNIRVLSYGLTSLRYLSAVLIGISIVTVLVSLIKNGKYISYVLFLIAACALVTTIGPFNLIDLPARSQEARLVSILKTNSMLDSNNKIIAKSNIDNQAKAEITSSYDYIKRSGADKSELLKANNTKSRSFNDIFGFNEVYSYDEGRQTPPDKAINTYVFYTSQSSKVSISGYSSLFDISDYQKSDIRKEISNNILSFNNDNKKFSFDLNNFVKALYAEYGSNTNLISQDRLVFEKDNMRLVITSMNFNVDNNGKINISNINGYVLS